MKVCEYCNKDSNLGKHWHYGEHVVCVEEKLKRERKKLCAYCGNNPSFTTICLIDICRSCHDNPNRLYKNYPGPQ